VAHSTHKKAPVRIPALKKVPNCPVKDQFRADETHVKHFLRCGKKSLFQIPHEAAAAQIDLALANSLEQVESVVRQNCVLKQQHVQLVPDVLQAHNLNALIEESCHNAALQVNSIHGLLRGICVGCEAKEH
jgi:fructosamine-3-kinase